MIKFISDLHIGHFNVIKYCDRGFKDEVEMNNKIIELWNKNVNDNDLVIIVGDLIFNYSKNYEIINELKGTKFLVLGNHDLRYKKKFKALDNIKVLTRDMFILNRKTIEEYEIYKFIDNEVDKKILKSVIENEKDFRFIISHYQDLTKSNLELNENDYIIYGHIHNNFGKFQKEFLYKYPKSLNCSYDIIGYPRGIVDLTEINKLYRNECEKVTDEQLNNNVQLLINMKKFWKL